MSYSSGEAAEQVVRMTLNGVEVAAKISGKAAENSFNPLAHVLCVSLTLSPG